MLTNDRRPPRWPALVSLGLVLVVLAIVVWPSGVALAGPPHHGDQVRFMWAMGQRESSGDYFSRNATSGAFGKYQIMPFNWPAWAAEYLGDGRADQTPYNQEKVAYGKLRDLYRWLGSWKRVAYWWLTGSSERNEKRWSSYAAAYVADIMRMRKRAPADGGPMPRRTSSRPQRGDWRRSGGGQRLRRDVAAGVWHGKGRVRDGQVLRVHAVKRARDGELWIRAITADGRLGWLPQSGTVPARQPHRPSRWRDIGDRGASPSGRRDRAQVRPRPR